MKFKYTLMPYYIANEHTSNSLVCSYFKQFYAVVHISQKKSVHYTLICTKSC